MNSGAIGKGGPLALRTRGLVKRFGAGEDAIVALNGVDLDAHYGEMLMIVGPSGCGKTTLLSTVCGTLKYDEGSVELFGDVLHTMKEYKVREFRRQNVGFIFQQFNLIPTLTALENASIPLLLQGMKRKPAEERAAAVLREVGLGDRMKHRPSELSGGQQQRVAIARALANNPRLLICDEPTAALDAVTGQKVVSLLKDIACKPDRCVLLVTHDNRIFHHGDRIAEMDDGKVVRIGSPEEITHV